MDRLQLFGSALCIGSGICDGMVVVVVGRGSVSGSSDSNIPTQLLLKFTTVRCIIRWKNNCSVISPTISFPTKGT